MYSVLRWPTHYNVSFESEQAMNVVSDGIETEPVVP